MWFPFPVAGSLCGMYPFRSPLKSSFTSTVEPLMVALFAGEVTFKIGLASSCSPRCFIMSAIVCGRGTTDSSCATGGEVVVVAVVCAFSFVAWQLVRQNEARHRARADVVILIMASRKEMD